MIDRCSIRNIYWNLKQYDEDICNYIMNMYNKDYHVSQIISNRIESVEHINDFLQPKLSNLLIDTYHLKDMKKSVDLIVNALLNKRKICIFGDYDVDGASATSLLYLFFKDLNLKADLYIPDRLKEGYGLNIAAIDKIYQNNCDIIIAVDNGSTAFKEIEYADNKGIKVVVLDHHITEDKMPKGLIVNPNRLDQITPYKNLCATGVTWMFCVNLRTAMESHIYVPKQKLLDYIEIVALATICDVMEMKGLNRFFVQYGIKVMNDGSRGNPGIKNLLNIIDESATVGVIGFKIGAMINAGSRLNNSYLATNLLTQDRKDSMIVANQLYNLNEVRKNIEKDIYDLAYDKALQCQNNSLLVLYADDWHIGVIGIIASRMVDEFNKPCIVISYEEGVGVGSCRSIPQVNIGEAIINAKKQGFILSGGGHAMAAGFKIDKDMQGSFIDFMNLNIIKSKRVSKAYDLKIPVTSINLLFFKKLKDLEPYGTGNHEPVLCISGIKISSTKVIKDMHIMCLLDNDIKLFAFRSMKNKIGQFLLDFNNRKKNFEVIGTLSEFKGKVSIIIQDIIVL